mgnify:CR=1 FL=1
MAKSNSKDFKRRGSEILRKPGDRQSKEITLIVCEGENTEPNYFRGLRAYLKLNSINVVIKKCQTGNDPMNLYNFSQKQIKIHDYDHVYCVFDKDNHSNYKEAIAKMEATKNKKNKIYAIPTVPCFEYWLLLHFEYSTSPYSTLGRKTAADQLISKLKNYIENYNKSDKKIFSIVNENDGLSKALTNAATAFESQCNVDTDNPSTRIHSLVMDLQKRNP